MMFFLLNKLITIWVQIRDTYLYFLYHAIIVNGYVDDHTWRGILHRNWGDDLNYYFLKELTGRSVVMYHNFKFAKRFHLLNYMCIGSVLDNYASPCNSNTVVWGSGTVGVKWQHQIPNKICAVRGPLTYKFLNEAKVNCPEVYGDPALLLPLVYTPQGGVERSSEREKRKVPLKRVIEDVLTRAKHNYTHESAVTHLTPRYHLGIIPHVVDLHHPVIEEIREKHAEEILIIDLAHYKKWTDVIDQICSCAKILSSSLHGLIVSDAYQVPSRWIELTGKISGGYFKYFDYAASVNRDFDRPIIIKTIDDISPLSFFHSPLEQDSADLAAHADSFFSCADAEKINELQKELLEVAPFKCRVQAIE